MARYPDNYVQSLDPEAIAKLPEFASYEGDARDLKHLVGLMIPTADIEKVVYVGERENVWVEDAEGNRWRPWAGVWITELDANGEPVVRGYDEPLPKPTGKNPMDRAELASLGFTDDSMAQALKEHLGEDYEADRPGPSQKRRDAFERLMTVLMG